MAHGRKSAILSIFLHSKHQVMSRDSKDTRDAPTESMTIHGPSLGPTRFFERDLVIFKILQGASPFLNKEEPP